jgi:hypothetical protein
MKSFSVPQLMMIGSIGAVIIIFLAMLNWRRAVYAALVVALFEGAIRKWIFPQASELVYFLKDIILFGAYAKFYLFPDSDVRAWKLRIPGTMIAAVCITLIAAGALNPNLGSVLMAAYGLKIYLWYIPLAFMIPLLWKNEAEMTTMLFRYSLFAIPICLIGTLQFVAPVDSWINTYADTNYIGVKDVATFGAGQAARARITGTFSYISGHAVFVMLFFTLSMTLFTSLPDKRRFVILFGTLPLLFANGLMSGSRTAVLFMLGAAAAIGIASAFTKLSKAKGTFLYFALAATVVVVGTAIFFDKALTAFETRRTHAGDSVQGRVFHFAWSVTVAAEEVDISGFGIGTAHPATWALRSALKIPQVKKTCPLYDAEAGQVLAELGWIGFLMWYGLRILIFLHCWEAYRTASPSLFKSMCLGIVLIHAFFLPSQMVFNHTANLFLCTTWGFCLIPRLQSLVPRSLPNELTARLPAALSRRGSKVPRLNGNNSPL